MWEYTDNELSHKIVHTAYQWGFLLENERRVPLLINTVLIASMIGANQL